ncbi:MAG: adenylate cyclase [uncultured bacterium]|uniref:Adenylate cyclase n=1 Tax=Candidatus Wolfebacteria bacterium GW2011_GWE2_44_13 TaxID=1619017 RepID=A0A0G1HAZ2_9BACT|nr:MAG: adenylate cyclase [uncultured bacterium]KKT43678.1 MAG: Adenylate cyclase [Candidatus Wolfebacteria bacterium GW2011_GWE2_44_13]
MKNEIERKFFVKEMTDLSGAQPLHYERYFLDRGNGKEVRISKINDSYIYEEKSELSELERTRDKKEITKEEFYKLKENASEGLIRDRYSFSSNPDIVIQVYHGRFEGLVCAEVEFDSAEAANAFSPLSWMGREMTGLPIARDARLIELSSEEFKKYLVA